MPPNETSYRYILFDIYTIRGTTLDYVSLSKIEFKDSNGNAFQFPSDTSVYCSNPCYTGEGAENLIDGSVDTKMTAYWSSYGKVCRVWITLPEGRYIDLGRYNQFSWYTENNTLSRDPVTWRLFAYKEATHGWDGTVLLNSENDYAVTTTRKALAYTGTISLTTMVSTVYQYLKLRISANRGDSTYMQFSDLIFEDGAYNTFTYPTGTTITASLSPAGGGETVDKLIDYNTSTKYCARWNSSTGCDIVITFPSSSKMDISTYKIFTWYTANDVPNRDPISWQLFMANSSDFSDQILSLVEIGYNVTTVRQRIAYEGYI